MAGWPFIACHASECAVEQATLAGKVRRASCGRRAVEVDAQPAASGLVVGDHLQLGRLAGPGARLDDGVDARVDDVDDVLLLVGRLELLVEGTHRYLPIAAGRR
jgi:hypothetical protein